MKKFLNRASREPKRLVILGTVGITTLAFAFGALRHRPHRNGADDNPLIRASARSIGSRSHRKSDPALPRIAALVQTLRPEKGPRYAWSVAADVIQSARANRISPYVVSATAVVESEFDMDAGPCIGVMQMYPETVACYYSHRRLNPRAIQDNISMGTNYLARHYRSELACRAGTEEVRLSRMWGRYNGAGPNSVYSRRVLRVLRRIKTGSPASWRRTIRSTGSLWGTQDRTLALR